MWRLFRWLAWKLSGSFPADIRALAQQERFTDRSLHILRLSLNISARWNHEYIGTEHLLLALLEEGSGVGACALKQLMGDLGRAKQAMERLMITGPASARSTVVPFTPRAKLSLQAAVGEARRMRDDYVGSEHLLLGLLQDRNGVTCQVMSALGIDAETTRSEINRLLGRALL